MRRAIVTAVVSVGALWAAPVPAQAGVVSVGHEWCRDGQWCSWTSSSILLWKGEPGENNHVTATRVEGGRWVVTESGDGARLVAGQEGCSVEDRTAVCDETHELVFQGSDGDDVISTDGPNDSYADWYFEQLFGDAGDDTLDGGDHGCCLGAWLSGDSGHDVLRGGSGEYDAVTYYGRNDPLDVSLAPRPAGARNGGVGEQDVIGEDVEEISGGAGDDVLIGDDGPNSLNGGGGGSDVLRAGGGDDYLTSYSRDEQFDQLYGEGGNDRFTPGTRMGLVDGGPGRDEVMMDNFWPGDFLRLSIDGKANDGSVGSEDFYYGPYVPKGNLVAVEDLRAGRVDDLLVGDDGPNRLEAGAGSDVIDARGGSDVVWADSSWEYDLDGDDFVMVLDGEYDKVTCRGGIDVVIADPDDELSDDCEQRSEEKVPLPDVKIAWPPPPPLPDEFGPGYDEPMFPVLPVPVGPQAGVGTPPPSGPGGPSCEQVGGARNASAFRVGSGQADCMVGGKRADWLNGAGGADRLLGASGPDRLLGGKGNDWLDGGGGDDRADGGGGDDFVMGAGGNDDLLGGGGDDTVVAADGARDTIDCGKGRDTAVLDRSDRARNCEYVSRTKSKKG